MPWLRKSTEYYSSSNKLINESFFNSSIHCSYYSVMQMMYHTLSEELGYDENYIRMESTKSKSSHEWLLTKIVKLIRDFESEEIALDYYEKVLKLKRCRVAADYYTKQYSLKEAQKNRQRSFDLQEQLKTIFKI